MKERDIKAWALCLSKYLLDKCSEFQLEISRQAKQIRNLKIGLAILGIAIFALAWGQK